MTRDRKKTSNPSLYVMRTHFVIGIIALLIAFLLLTKIRYANFVNLTIGILVSPMSSSPLFT